MFKVLLFSLFILPYQAFCTEQDLTFKNLVQNLEIRADAFATSSDGSKIMSVDRGLILFRTISQIPSMSALWKTNFDGLPEAVMEAEIKIQSDLSINLVVSQYTSLKWDKKIKNNIGDGLIKRESFVVKNFAPIVWVYKATKDKNIVVRLIPLLPTQLEAEELTYPLMGITDAIVSDNGNHLWVQGIGGAGQVVSVGSEFGTVYFSFMPFKNSKEIGFAYEDVLTMNLTAAHTLRVRSRSSIVGGGIKAKVYGFYLPNKKRPGGSVSAMTAEQASREAL